MGYGVYKCGGGQHAGRQCDKEQREKGLLGEAKTTWHHERYPRATG